jgi:hypothetical protein
MSSANKSDASFSPNQPSLTGAYARLAQELGRLVGKFLANEMIARRSRVPLPRDNHHRENTQARPTSNLSH